MVKLMYIITPKAGMSRDEFKRYWLEIHAPDPAPRALRDQRLPAAV
jgi:hypothetical protein